MAMILALFSALGDDVVGLVGAVGLGEGVDVGRLRPVVDVGAVQARRLAAGVAVGAVEGVDRDRRAMPAALASCSGCFTVWQSMASSTMPSTLAAMAWRTSADVVRRVELGVIERRRPSRWPWPRPWRRWTGTELLLAAWPAEITTIFLPFAAGRDVGIDVAVRALEGQLGRGVGLGQRGRGAVPTGPTGGVTGRCRLRARACSEQKHRRSAHREASGKHGPTSHEVSSPWDRRIDRPVSRGPCAGRVTTCRFSVATGLWLATWSARQVTARVAKHGCGVVAWILALPRQLARGRAPQRTRPRPVIRGRSSAVSRPGAAATTAGTALTSRMAVALSPAVLWSPSVPMSCRSSV